ncbi:MAG: hypothetical protein ACRDTT_09925 [Pseudonocardiaceae bacterium]
MRASLDASGWSATLRTERRALNLAEVVGAYYRRPSTWDLPADLSAAERRWSASEARYGFGGVMEVAVPWLNAPAAIGRAEYKPVQLHAAVRAGLRVPATLITNAPEAARRFAREHDGRLIYKSLSGEIVSDDEGVKAIYTTAVTVDDSDDTSIVGTAHLFQEQITEKAFEVRITAVADVLFAVALRSESELGRLDWRRDFKGLSYEVIPSAQVGAPEWRPRVRPAHSCANDPDDDARCHGY